MPESTKSHFLFFDGVASDLSVRRVVLRLCFYGNDEHCVASLKARAVLVDGVSHMEGDPCCPTRERESEKIEREKKVRIRQRNKGSVDKREKKNEKNITIQRWGGKPVFVESLTMTVFLITVLKLTP